MADAALIGSRGVVGASASVTTGSGASSASASFAVAVIFSGAQQVSSISDSKGNTYTEQKTQVNSNGDVKVAIYLCVGGTGGSGHTATVNFSGTSDATAWLIQLDGIAAADTAVGAQDGTDPYEVTSGTLAQDENIVLTLFGADRGSTGTISTSNSTLIDSEPAGTTGWPGGVSKKTTASTSPVTVSWSDAHGAHNDALVLLPLKVAASAAVTIGSDAGSRRNRPGRGPYSRGRYFRPGAKPVPSNAAAPPSFKAVFARAINTIIGRKS